MAREWTPASRDSTRFEQQFAAATRAGMEAAEMEPRAESATYDPRDRTLTVRLRDGVSITLPVVRIQELAECPDPLLRKVRVTASGHGLHWDEAGVHLAVPQLFAGLFGRLSAQVLGRRGGEQRSAAKTRAARRNALLGGRPPTRSTVQREAEVMRVESSAGTVRRVVDVRVGGSYVVAPMNPAARRNRGRTGQVVDFGHAKDSRVQFRFADTGRVGLVEPSDLLPLQEEKSSAAD